MKMALSFFLCALLWCGTAVAAERQIVSCDTTTGFASGGSMSHALAATNVEGTGAVQVTVAGSGYTYYSLPGGDKGSFWNAYDGIAFKVKGESGAQWGVLDLWYDDTVYYHYFATFPITPGTWTEVVIPWNEFLARNFAGKIENHRAEVFAVGFRSLLTHDDAVPGGVTPAQVYDVDDIRLVDSLSVTTPTNGTGDLRNTVAKMVAKQPVTIIAMGASVTWGLKLQPNQVTQRWSALLEGMLRTHYGYSNITVINTGIGGGNSFTGEQQLGTDVYSHSNIDLIMIDDWYYNDYGNANGTGGAAEVGDNYSRLLDILLSHGFYSKSFAAHEVLYCNGALHAEPGNETLMDPYLAAVQAQVTARNIPIADYYHPMQALGNPYLVTNFYTNAGPDYVHMNAAGHAYMADKIYNAIIGLGGPVVNPVTVSAGSVTFAGSVGSVTPVTQTVTLTNTSAGTITITPTTSAAAWLNVGSPVTITAGNSTTMTFSADPTGLNGTYTATITLTNSTTGTRNLPVTFNVTTPPNPVTVSAGTVVFHAPEGSVTIVNQTITLHNTSGASITVTPSNGGTGWLNVGSAVTISAGGTATLTFAADPNGLNGTFTGTITLTNSTGETRTIPVSFTVGNSVATVKAGGCDLTVGAGAGSAAGAISTFALLAGFLVVLGLWRARLQ